MEKVTRTMFVHCTLSTNRQFLYKKKTHATLVMRTLMILFIENLTQF